MTSYNLQKGFYWALQAGGQGFESPKLLLAVRCNLLDRNSMGNWVQGRQIEIYPVPTSQQPYKP
jgi:hypothetical protein